MNKEITIAIKNDIIGGGEVGEPLTQSVIDLIRAMAKIGWWVVDFGEPSDPEIWNNDMTDLHFAWATSIDGNDGSVATAEHFIKCGGDI